jgi:hypothetical protein
MFLAAIRLKTVKRAQFNSRHPILVKYRPSRPNFFQTGRISLKSAHKKPTMDRISANLNDI